MHGDLFYGWLGDDEPRLHMKIDGRIRIFPAGKVNEETARLAGLADYEAVANEIGAGDPAFSPDTLVVLICFRFVFQGTKPGQLTMFTPSQEAARFLISGARSALSPQSSDGERTST